MKFQHKFLFLGCHLPPFESRVQIINPSQPATLPSSVQPYNKTRWLKVAPLQNHPSQDKHTYYLPPATFKPETLAIESHRRSPNRCTKLIRRMSSCSVHGPFLISFCTIFIFFFSFLSSQIS